MRKVYSILLISFLSYALVGQSYFDIADSKTGQLSFESMPVVGLWEVLLVNVGNEELTPTAKWFEILEGGKLLSGNGGITNYRGSWTFDKNTNLINQMTNGTEDPYGPFKVSFQENSMTWQRQEDGMKVMVSLKRIDEKPLAPWDLITGTWKSNKAEGLDKDTKEVKSIYNLEPNSYYFGWDGRYKKYDGEGKRIETGIWHIESHSPWLWTISDADNTKIGWAIEIKEQSMTWSKDGDSETLKIFFEKSEQ